MGLFSKKEKEVQIRKTCLCPHCEATIRETTTYEDESDIDIFDISPGDDYCNAIVCKKCKKIISCINIV